jgi:hypothetical protein
LRWESTGTHDKKEPVKNDRFQCLIDLRHCKTILVEGKPIAQRANIRRNQTAILSDEWQRLLVPFRPHGKTPHPDPASTALSVPYLHWQGRAMRQRMHGNDPIESHPREIYGDL